jgi:hypothetical protein
VSLSLFRIRSYLFFFAIFRIAGPLPGLFMLIVFKERPAWLPVGVASLPHDWRYRTGTIRRVLVCESASSRTELAMLYCSGVMNFAL